jgi:hypothetical protein
MMGGIMRLTMVDSELIEDCATIQSYVVLSVLMH